LKNNADNGNKKVVFACHEIPFTVITRASLKNSDRTLMGYSRNYPTGDSLLGSHMNQMDSTEDRGTYWISRLLEQFGCKLCIGGHKHTYALSYPIKENYQWSMRLENKVDDKYQYNDSTNSLDTPKYMTSTLEDESGSEPKYKINWTITANYKVDNNPYNISSQLKESGDIHISSTKTPYIPKDLYDSIGVYKFSETKNDNGQAVSVNMDFYRSCTPIDTPADDKGVRKYDGFVNYSMCQATGYKLKSNKELPSPYQVFSKLIPKTNCSGSSDKPDGNQLYPMFSVLEFEHNGNNNDIVAINVMMCRVAGIFKADGKDSFTQTSYGTGKPSIYYLISVDGKNVDKINNLNKENIKESEYMYGAWVSKKVYDEDLSSEQNKYLYIKY
jgi:hypothetical protein